MKSDVDAAFGFSRSILFTGTPVFDEITANVSPALTVQNFGRGWWTTCVDAAAGGVESFLPDRRPD